MLLTTFLLRSHSRSITFGNHDAKSLIYSLTLIFLSPFFTQIYMMIRILNTSSHIALQTNKLIFNLNKCSK